MCVWIPKSRRFFFPAAGIELSLPAHIFLYLTRSCSQKPTVKHSTGGSVVYQALIGFHLVPRYCKHNKEGQVASKTMDSNSTSGGKAVVVHLSHVHALSLMPTCLFLQSGLHA